MTNLVRYIALEKSYTENCSSKYKHATTEAYQKLIDTSSSPSRFEILSGTANLKMYFDIEKIPNENIIKPLIDDLIYFIKKTAGIDIVDYALTYNSGSSSHSGHSYHLILQGYCTTQDNMRNLVNHFIAEIPAYEPYIDVSVYSHNRFFRSINQAVIAKAKK